MDDEAQMDGISEADVLDAVEDIENTEAVPLMVQFYNELKGKDASVAAQVAHAKRCATMFYSAKRYEDMLVFLDLIATQISDNEGPDSEAYMAFTEDEALEDLRLKATDKSLGDEEDEDYEIEDE